MIFYLKGIIALKSPVTVVIDCHGVGYDVKIPMSTYDKLPEQGAMVQLYIHYYQNDEGVRLYGFISEAERDLFRLLITVSHIGPKIAISALSSMTIDQIAANISLKDEKALAKIPGLGLKSAQRLIVELKDKILDIPVDASPLSLEQHNIIEAEQALITLGYKQQDIRKTISDLGIQNKSPEAIIKEIIKYLYKKRN